MSDLKLAHITFASASFAAESIRRGDITSFELTRHILRRIDRYNPSINAVITIMREEALASAKAADESLKEGSLRGALHGVPITIKDCFEISSVKTTAGSPSRSDYIPRNDSIAVAKLREAGAVIIGHTNVPIMAGDWQSYNAIFGTTNNPWDLERTPGGSTGGGAAALAAGMSFMSLGSDVGGSIRIPAHFCGVYGHRSSINLVSLEGHIPSPPYHPQILWAAGPLARSAEDLKLSLKILGGPAPEESKAYSWTLPLPRGNCLSDYRLGFVIDHVACPLAKDVKNVMLDAVEKLRREGLDIEEGWPEGLDPLEEYDTYRFLMASIYAGFLKDDEYEDKRRQSMIQDGSYESISARSWTAPHKHFQDALKKRMKSRIIWQDYFKTHDAFMLPVSFIPAFSHEHSQPFWNRRLATLQGPRKYEELYFWISFATLPGLPVTVAPIGLSPGGLPVGVQIIGPHLEDATPIDVATKMTDVTGGFKPPPGFKN